MSITVGFKKSLTTIQKGLVMRAKKWNTKTRKYEEYDLPIGAVTYIEDLDTVIPCASCGKPVIAGNTYTSLEIHTDGGFGYLVCADCYKNEMNRRFENK